MELAGRMGGQPKTPGVIPSPKAAPAPDVDPIGGAAEGGQGFGQINKAQQQPTDKLPEFDPNAGFNFDPKAGTEGGGALGSLASGLTGSLSMANALRKGGKKPFEGIKNLFADTPQVPETTPLV